MTIEPKQPKTESQVRIEERTRLAAILESREAETRPKVAKALAIDTNLSAERIKEILATLPEEKEPRTNAAAFFAMMEKEGHTGVGSALGSAPANDPKAQRIEEIRQAATAHNLAAGYISPQQAAARGLKVRGI